MEDKMRALSKKYVEQGIGYLNKQHPAMYVDRDGNRRQAKGDCDFMGCWNRLPVYFECKQTVGDRFYVSKKDERIQRQVANLWRWHDINRGLGMMLIMHVPSTVIYAYHPCELPAKGNLFDRKFAVSKRRVFGLEKLDIHCKNCFP